MRMCAWWALSGFRRYFVGGDGLMGLLFGEHDYRRTGDYTYEGGDGTMGRIRKARLSVGNHAWRAGRLVAAASFIG